MTILALFFFLKAPSISKINAVEIRMISELKKIIFSNIKFTLLAPKIIVY